MVSLSSVQVTWVCLMVTWVLAGICAGRERLTIGTILTDYYYLRRSINGALTKAYNRYNNDANTKLSEKYVLHGEIKFMKDYSPTKILDAVCNVVLEKHVNTVVYLSNADYDGKDAAAVHYLLQICNFLGIPVIAWNGDNSGFFQPTAESIILQMAPSVGHQCQAMLSLLRRYNWRSFAILAGNTAGVELFISILRDLVDESDSWFEILTVIQFDRMEKSLIQSQLQKLDTEEVRVILVYASSEEAELVMAEAGSMGYTGKEYVWVVSQSVVGANPFADARHGADTSLLPPGMMGMYFPAEKPQMVDALENAFEIWVTGMESLMDDLDPVEDQHVSLVPNMVCNSTGSMHWPHGQTLYNYLLNVSLESLKPPLSFSAEGIVKDTQLRIVNLNENHDWEEIGRWTAQDGIELDDITWPGLRHSPPKGQPSKYHLKVVTLKEQPYVVYSNPDPKTGKCPPQAEICRVAPLNETIGVPNVTTNASLYQCCSGLCIDLLKMLAEKMSFEFELFEVDDEKWGAFDRDKGEWNGLVRALMDGKADIAMTSLKITPERNEKIDFSVPFLETGITIIVGVRDGVISPTAFLEPFDILSWIFILLMCIHVVAVTVFLFEWLSPYGFDMLKLPPREPYDYPSWCLILVFSVHASGAALFIYEWLSPSGLDRGNKPIREHRFSLFRSFWLIWAMLFGAAVNTDNPRGVSSRFMASIWALFAVVFTASYTANLAAFMITKEDYDRLSGIQDWRLVNPYAHKPPFKFATVPHGSTETNLMKNYPDMYRYMKPYNKTKVEDGVRAVKDGEINAFIYDATVLEYLASHDKGCRLRTVGNWYAMTGYGVGFQRGSKWIDRFNKYMTQFQHDGEMERLQKFWLAGACSQRKEEGETSNALGILNFTSAFILLAGGMLLGGLLLLLEHIYFKFFRHKLRKWDRCGCCGLVSLSMGKSLTFEQSVREAMDLQKHHKCKNPICETQLWKVKHELDLALLKIDRMQRQIQHGDRGGLPDRRGGWKNGKGKSSTGMGPPAAVGWKDGRGRGVPGVGPPPPIGWKVDRDTGPPPPIGWKDDRGFPDSEPPPGIGWRPEILPPPDIDSPYVDYDPPDECPYPVYKGERPQALSYEQQSPLSQRHSDSSKSNKKGSKSLPTSPVKKPLTSPVWKPDIGQPAYGLPGRDAGDQDRLNNGPMKRATSFPNTRDPSVASSPQRRSGDNKKTRQHKGNVYIEIDNGSVEKETVL